MEFNVGKIGTRICIFNLSYKNKKIKILFYLVINLIYFIKPKKSNFRESLFLIIK